MKEYIIFGMVALVLVLVVIQSFQINGLKESNQITSTGKIDMSGWTENEKMMYEHHGTLPAKLQGAGSAIPKSAGMVGGC